MYTVIVADDEEELRRALIQKVDWSAAGFQVIGEAENGAEAIELVERLEPDLLLTDIRMPFITGIELAGQVREIRPTTQIAFLSGYDDFSYAQQAIQYNIISYLLKPISAAEMNAELIKIREKIDEKFNAFAAAKRKTNNVEIVEFLIPLVLDGFQKREDSTNVSNGAIRCGLIHSIQSDLQYIIMVSSLWNEEGNNETDFATVNAIDIILRKYIRHTSFYTNGRVVSLLMASHMDFERYLHILIDDIAQSVSRILNLTVSIGVSRQVESLMFLHEAYVEAMNALGYSKKNGTRINFISDLERTEHIDLEQIQSYVNELETLIRSGGSDELEKFLNCFFDMLGDKFVSPSVSGFMLSEITSAVFRIVYAVADKEGVQKLQTLSPVQFRPFDDSNSMRKQYLMFCQAARELVLEQRKKSSEIICEKAINIIERDYADSELSLLRISREIAVSPNYLSSLIRKKIGNTFVDLLTKQRIDKACELLISSDMKIREISERCGYSDQHYFSYCFKKYTGISPLSYRQKNGSVVP